MGHGRARQSIRRLPREVLNAMVTANTVGRRRGKVFKRESHATCAYRGVRRDRKGMTVDHVVPTSRGGTDDPSNLVAACQPCNRKKAWRTGDEFRAWLATDEGRAWLREVRQ